MYYSKNLYKELCIEKIIGTRRIKMSEVITFINMKGGVGKTTLAVNVAYTLSKIEGKKVLLIDMDPQMNATQYTLIP